MQTEAFENTHIRPRRVRKVHPFEGHVTLQTLHGRLGAHWRRHDPAPNGLRLLPQNVRPLHRTASCGGGWRQWFLWWIRLALKDLEDASDAPLCGEERDDIPAELCDGEAQVEDVALEGCEFPNCQVPV